MYTWIENCAWQFTLQSTIDGSERQLKPGGFPKKENENQGFFFEKENEKNEKQKKQNKRKTKC